VTHHKRETNSFAGNIGDTTFMYRSAMLPNTKLENEGIGSKVNFPFQNCPEVYSFAFSSCRQKAALPLRW
jgi:hypothetical protein